MSVITLERRADLPPGVQGRATPRVPLPRLARLRAFALPAVLLLLWQSLTSAGVFPDYLLPAPAAVANELLALAAGGVLAEHIAITVWRVAVGFAAGALAATLLGALTGYSSNARAYLDPTLQALKAVPSLAWVPLFILWFGIFEASKITLIGVGVFFPVYLNLMSGIQSTDRKLVEVARVNGLGRFDLIRRILIPATLPSYLTGLRSGLALGWMFVIAAELMGASQGLGFLMIDGQMTGRPAIIIGALLLFAVAGKLSDALIAATAKRLTAWQDGYGASQEAGRA
ncbi:ABC transporter permease [Aquibaculum sediminis]|uniref:ABC transporter permease n=1 Tax=Aquibaculum sediminis TaxID=3231907 RepID=UPI003452B1AD